MPTIITEITSYSVVEGRVVETTTTQIASVIFVRGYMKLGNCAGSAPINQLRWDVEVGNKDWYAQAGAPPVYVAPCPSFQGQRPCSSSCGCGPGDTHGGWGGHVYPQVKVTNAELRNFFAANEMSTT